MTGADLVALAGDIESLVRGIPGVTSVYRAGSAAARLVDAGARLLGRGDEPPRSVVAVARGEDGLRVEVAIGVAVTGSAAATVGEVHRGVVALLEARGEPDADVRITVVHVDEAPAPAPSV